MIHMTYEMDVDFVKYLYQILIWLQLSIMHRVRRAFEAFDDLDWDVAQFVELRIFPRCD
jgi:hypothetical protein